MCLIRPENSADHAAIRHVHTLAFGQPNEAELVDALRRHQALTLSLVAVQDHHLGIPAHITQTVLLPMADCTGDNFKLARRVPARERTYWDSWDQMR